MQQSIQLVRPAATWAAAAVPRGPSAALKQTINEPFDSWPVVSVLPPLNLRPLDLVERDRPNNECFLGGD